MPNFIITKSSLKGLLRVPPSKSQTLRAILFASMAKGTSIIRGYLHSPDTIAMIKAMRSFGAQITIYTDHLLIKGLNGILPRASDVINAGNSGIILRFIGALAALSDGYTVITGDASIKNNRPVRPLLDSLKQLGVFAESMRCNDHAPIIVKGPLAGGKACLDGADSQPVSGLLIAGAFSKKPLEIYVQNPGEKPWLDLTLHWLERLKIAYSMQGYEHFVVRGSSGYAGFEYTVPGDFSSAAFPIVAALITNSQITIENLDFTDCQGDKVLVAILRQMGAKITIAQNGVKVHKGTQLKGMEIDVNHCIDALPILAVAGCFADGVTVLKGGQIARQKESDRIQSITRELRKMGAMIDEKPDGMIIKGCRLQSAAMDTYKDHRLVLSLAVAAMGCEGKSMLFDVDAVNKTYGDFARDFINLGANIEVVS